MSKIYQLEIFVKFRKEVGNRRASREKEGKQNDNSREEVEISILETQWRLADAAENHDFNLCSRLQRDIRELEVRHFFTNRVVVFYKLLLFRQAFTS